MQEQGVGGEGQVNQGGAEEALRGEEKGEGWDW